MNIYEIKKITQAAIIAALYIVLTMLSNALGLAQAQIQLRLSEALTILPVFLPSAIPGLFVGCLLANIITGALLPDVIIGSLTTLLAAILTYHFRKNKYLAVASPVILNSISVPLLLYYAYGIRPLWLSFIGVFAGEFVSAGIFGLIIYNEIKNNHISFF